MVSLFVSEKTLPQHVQSVMTSIDTVNEPTEVCNNIENMDNLWELLSSMQLETSSTTDTHTMKQGCVNEDCDGQENDFVTYDTDKVCGKCGTVQYKNIDFGAEWRYYGCDDNKTTNPTRCGMPTNEFLPKSSLGTVIGMENMRKNYYQMLRIRKYHMWNSMPYKERSLYNVISRLNQKANSGGIATSIIDDAKAMYKKISETKISRGDNRNGLIASSLYMSCKNNGVPRSAKEIASIFNLKISTMTKGCKKFHEIMKSNVASTNPEDFIVRFCSKLNRPDIVDESMTIVHNADKYSIVSENAPPSIAAGSIYLCCVVNKYDITKRDISKACEISEVTINKCYKKLSMFIDYLLPDKNKVLDDESNKNDNVDYKMDAIKNEIIEVS